MASPSWIILSTLPRVALLDNNADVSLAPLDAPPRVSLLTLSPRLFPSLDPRARLKLPYLHAADPSGLLLAVTPPPPTPPCSSSPSPSVSSDDSEGDGVVTDIPCPVGPDYYVLDVPAVTATIVDMRARKVVEFQAHEPAKGAVSPSSVLVLVLPPALTAGLPVETSDDGVKGDESRAPPSDCQGA